jgi:hypothetical protein
MAEGCFFPYPQRGRGIGEEAAPFPFGDRGRSSLYVKDGTIM